MLVCIISTVATDAMVLKIIFIMDNKANQNLFLKKIARLFKV